MAVAEKGDSGEMWDDLNLDIIAGIDGRHWPMGGRHCWRFGESLRSAVIWTDLVAGPGCAVQAIEAMSLTLSPSFHSLFLWFCDSCVSGGGES